MYQFSDAALSQIKELLNVTDFDTAWLESIRWTIDDFVSKNQDSHVSKMLPSGRMDRLKDAHKAVRNAIKKLTKLDAEPLFWGYPQPFDNLEKGIRETFPLIDKTTTESGVNTKFSVPHRDSLYVWRRFAAGESDLHTIYEGLEAAIKTLKGETRRGPRDKYTGADEFIQSMFHGYSGLVPSTHKERTKENFKRFLCACLEDAQGADYDDAFWPEKIQSWKRHLEYPKQDK